MAGAFVGALGSKAAKAAAPGAVTITAPSTSSNQLVAVVAINDAANAITSISGGATTWTRVARRIYSAGFCAAEIWVGTGPLSGTSVTFTASAITYGIQIFEVSGCDGTVAADTAGADYAGTTTSPATGGFSGACVAGALAVAVWAMVGTRTLTGGPSNGWANTQATATTVLSTSGGGASSNITIASASNAEASAATDAGSAVTLSVFPTTTVTAVYLNPAATATVAPPRPIAVQNRAALVRAGGF